MAQRGMVPANSLAENSNLVFCFRESSHNTFGIGSKGSSFGIGGVHKMPRARFIIKFFSQCLNECRTVFEKLRIFLFGDFLHHWAAFERGSGAIVFDPPFLRESEQVLF